MKERRSDIPIRVSLKRLKDSSEIIFDFMRCHWWVVAFSVILILTLGTRLWGLGVRALHYDEILHAWYSWRYVEGLGYNHTPLTHGPFLFHGAAASYFLFGSSDLTSRLLPALFGVAIVGLPFLLRRELGRAGVLISCVLLALSPSFLYFSRFLRNDIYMAFWLLALVIVMWRYIERPRTILLVAWVALWAFSFTTKESAFISSGILGLYLFFLSAPDIWRWLRGNKSLKDLSPPTTLLLVLATITLPLWGPILGLIQGWLGIVLVNPDPNDPFAGATRAAADTGSPVGASLYIAVVLTFILSGVSMFLGLSWDKRRWPLLVAVYLVVFVLLFSSFGTNWGGIVTGTWGSLGYWVAQQAVERAGQPWYYYLLLLFNYEFLIFWPALLGIPFLLRKGNRFDRFLVYWALITLAAFSYAGERMPWLLVGITLPIALVTARSLGLLIEWLPWRILGAYKSVIAIVLGGVVLMALGWGLVVSVQTPESLLPIAFALVFLSLPLTLLLLWARGRKHGVPPIFGLLGLGACIVLLGLTVQVSGNVSYRHSGYERPTEMFVYSQTGQETSNIADLLDYIAVKSGKGTQDLVLLIDESDNFSWQWRWYAREFTNLTFRSFAETPLEQAPDVDIVMMAKGAESRNKNNLEGFTKVADLNHLWWFPNFIYKGITFDSFTRDLQSRSAWESVVDYFFFRRMATEMYHSEGVVYVSDQYLEWVLQFDNAH